MMILENRNRAGLRSNAGTRTEHTGSARCSGSAIRPTGSVPGSILDKDHLTTPALRELEPARFTHAPSLAEGKYLGLRPTEVGTLLVLTEPYLMGWCSQ